MGEIYSQAESVIVWPGSVSPISEDLQMILLEAQRSTEGRTKPPMDTSIALLLLHVRSVPSAAWSNTYHVDVFDEFKAILRLKWFTRAWVFQEVVLPQRSRFIIMSPSSWNRFEFTMVVSLSDLYCTFASLSRNYVEKAQEWGSAEYATTPRTLIDMYHRWNERRCPGTEQIHLPVYQVLSMVTPEAQTSNELDRLYAFFGLNTDSSTSLRPNYSHDIRQALTDTTSSIIKGASMLDIFETIPRTSGIKLTVSIPSWVPDFLSAHLVVPFQPSLQKDRGTDNGGFGSMNAMYPWSGIVDEQQLHVRGRVVDILESQIPSSWANLEYTDKEKYLSSVLADAQGAWSRKEHAYVSKTTSDVL